MRKPTNRFPPIPILPDDEIVTGKELIKRLKIKRSTLYELRRNWRDDPLPAIRGVGKALKFHIPSVLAWLNRRAGNAKLAGGR